jgi:hypothetical protein
MIRKLKGWNHLIVKGDLMLIIDLIKKLRDGPQPKKVTNNLNLLHPLENISSMFDSIEIISLSHTRRETNKLVDHLVGHGVTEQVTDLELGWEELISSELGETIGTLANRIIQGS